MRNSGADALTWKWRLWIPEGRKYVIHLLTETVPAQGFPRGKSQQWIMQPGEMWIEYRIARDPNGGGRWTATMATPFGSLARSGPEWAGWPQKLRKSDGVAVTTAVADPARAFLLVRHRVSQESKSTDIEEPSAGFMIWLEPTR